MNRKHLLFTIVLLLLVVAARPAATAQEEFYHPELDWRTIETSHFLIHYHEGTERTARVVATVAEEIYEPVTSLYQHEPDSKVSFVIKDYDDYSNGAAYFYDNKIEIWASSLDFDLRGSHNWLRNVITHEFTHIVQIQTAMKFGRRIPAFYFQWLGYESERRTDVLYGYPNKIVSYPISGFIIPSWFAEGVAQFNRRELGYDSWDSHRDMILRMYALDSNMLTWNAMSVFGKTSLGNESSYNAGFAFVRYLSDKYGDETVREISRNLSSLTAVTIDGAIEKATGTNGRDLYNEWQSSLQSSYAERTAGIKNTLAAGDVIAPVGFGNFYPTFSPDGKMIAYISNKESDFFFSSSLYLYDVEKKTEKEIKENVRSTFSWSPDGKKVYYSKSSRKNPHWSNYFDIYVYDIENEKETRLTFGARGNSPAVSPDGKSVAYVAASDGTINIFVMDADGSNTRQITRYASGEQVYNPKWYPDGATIIYDYSIKDGRDIVTVAAAGGEPVPLLAAGYDERNAVYTPDGLQIIYASDESGIFNLYRRTFASGETVQLTNVLGGAFMPTVNAAGQIAFASYTSTGYKISLLPSPAPLAGAGAYQRAPEVTLASASSSQAFDWQKLRSYDDRVPREYESTTYKSTASSLTLVPFLRVDNYNPRNKGIDVLKPGLYFFSYDMLDRYGFFAGAAMNLKGERDLFFTFDYRGKLPGLFQLGWEPALSLEAYNVTRKTDAKISLPLDTIGVGVTYNLLEFDVVLRQKLLTEELDLELRYAHSRYTASIGSFRLPDIVQPIQAYSELYLIGNDLSATFNYDGVAPSLTRDINPRGRKIRLRYDYEFSSFNPTGDYDIENGMLVPKYQKPRFHRLELSWREHQRLPGWKHTLSMQLRGGSILGPPVDDFFDFYIGGLAGMKGYPFYSLGGNEFAYANLTYRFPVFERIDLRVLHLYFDKLYAAFYGDIGNTWMTGNPSGLKFKRDAGIELRLQAFSYYSFPTRIFVNATYGFDKFTRTSESTNETFTYGREWNFHLGVLFGFDLD